ncbi:hypothetical protein N0V93_008242 [Gnomoniopsis smithogilvyi]|uniref:BTB domain-containing protein n=1 Tax=Gnomoniopsis smithogilvyi TaxID=1191159 RepID=A0A9W9CTI2_9PEZI|nr:hypothetical protein N0V93_008242 [Gnomoniopsis smithogilvyi]
MSHLSVNNEELFQSGMWSDVEIVCQDKTWKLHKAILGGQCKWFATALQDKSTRKDGATDQIRLDEEDPELLNAVLRYIYTDSIPLNINVEPLIPDLKRLLCLYYLADFLLLDDLVDSIRVHFDGCLVAAIQTLYTFDVISDCIKPKPKVHSREAVDAMLDSLRRATVRAYHQSGELHREFQKKLAVVTYGLRDHMPRNYLKLLGEEVADFHHDLYTILTFNHFTRFSSVYEEPLEDILDAYHCQLLRTAQALCVICEQEMNALYYFKFDSTSAKSIEIVLDPFTAGCDVFCTDCARKGLNRHIQRLMSDCWPSTGSEDSA